MRKSESLTSIAHKYDVSVEELKSVNSISGSRVNKGDRIIIPGSKSAKKNSPAENAKFYKVESGDTLPGIARKTGVRMSEIRRLNSIKSNKVKPGQLLALTDPAPQVRTKTAQTPKLHLINKDLLNEQEFTDTLAELTDISVEKPVDLAKAIESDAVKVNKLKNSAYSFLGARYRFGGSSRNSLDCSSFVQQVFREQNIRLPRTAREQFNVGTPVFSELRKGDLVFFRTYASFPSHVGIYLGDRKMIHASSRDRRVIVSSMDTPYYLSRYLGAKRIDKLSPEIFNVNELLNGVEEETESDVLTNDMLGLSASNMFNN